MIKQSILCHGLHPSGEWGDNKEEKSEEGMLKAVILAAGYGTRLFPVTKSIPKEMLPLVTKPSIDFIIEELLLSGIEDILLISSRRKKPLEDYLDNEIELETVLARKGSKTQLEKLKPPEARFYFIRQRQMLGTGHALMLAKPFVGNDPFIVALPDDIHMGEKPLAAQLIELYRETGCCVLSSLSDPPDLNRYGLLSLDDDGLHVKAIVEKPPKGEEPSREASIGRYLYTPEFMTLLEEGFLKHKGGEYHHIYALNKMAKKGKVVFKRIEGTRYDLGHAGGYLKALLDYARGVPELKAILDQEFGGRK